MNDSFKDTETIMDSLYGIIKVSPFEKNIICTPEFQRLRGIKQLGFVNLVYPAAEHSRFVHSIGVCHQAKNLTDQINENISNNARYKRWSNTPIELQETPKITTIERVVISATALIHDITHLPFSHEFESTIKFDNKGIPNHDDFENNPAMFTYLFDEKNSSLAKIISYYNNLFIKELENDKKWNNLLNAPSKGKKIHNGRIKFKVGSNSSTSTKKYIELPLLGVLIFEILLFDDTETFLSDYLINDEKLFKTKRVKCDWDINYIDWYPLIYWHRHYRKDIICDTICADLLDFIQRDGIATGTTSKLDLKFLDRMVIAKTLHYKSIDKENIPIDKIPECCEHIVFDIYDFKRKLIRESIISELVGCLNVRYQLFERVYNHRVVEGAKAMLHRIIQLLCEVDVLNTKLLYDIYSDSVIKPTEDSSFFDWILYLNQDEKGKIPINNVQDKRYNNIKLAAELVLNIKKRKVFREFSIYNCFNKLNSELNQDNRDKEIAESINSCKILSLKFKEAIVKRKFIELIENKNKELKEIYFNRAAVKQELPDELILFGFSNFGSKFKNPNFLVIVPDKQNTDKITILKNLDNPVHIKEMLDSIELAYYSLWRIYIFIHPAFFNRAIDNYSNIFKKISDELDNSIYNILSVQIKNSIENYQDLIPFNPIDIDEILNRSIDVEIEKALNSSKDRIVIIRSILKEKIINELKIKVYSNNELVKRLSFYQNRDKVITLIREEPFAARRKMDEKDENKQIEYYISTIYDQFLKILS